MRYSCFNKQILVTGASSGIGRELSYTLAERGAVLVLVGRNTDELKITQAECKKRSLMHHDKNIDHYIYSIDLTDNTKMPGLAAFLESNSIALNILVLNAGTSIHANLRETSVDTYRNMFELNCISAITITQATLPQLVKNKAMVVVINSIQSVIGVPHHAAYSIAKHALSAYIETLELEEPDLDIVEMKLGWVRNTNIRKNALDSTGRVNPSRKKDNTYHRTSVSLATCVKKIVYGIEKKKRYIYIPDFWKHILFVKYLFRWVLNRIIKNRSNKDAVTKK